MAAASDAWFALEQGPAGAWRLRAREPEPRLLPRQAGSALRTPHPGTAVRVDGGLLEVVGIEDAAPPLRVAYLLAPFDERHTARLVVDLRAGGLAVLERQARAE